MSTDPAHSSDGFDAVVAGWRTEGGVPQWPDFDGPPPTRDRTLPESAQGGAGRSGCARGEPAPSDTAAPAPVPGAAGRGDTGRGDTGRGDGVERGPAVDPLADDDHFVPGEPPPLPRLAAPIAVGLVLLLIGLVLVWAPGWVGVPQVYGLPLGLVGLAAGLGWLVLRLWPDPDGARPPLGHDPDDPDDGAVL